MKTMREQRKERRATRRMGNVRQKDGFECPNLSPPPQLATSAKELQEGSVGKGNRTIGSETRQRERWNKFENENQTKSQGAYRAPENSFSGAKALLKDGKEQGRSTRQREGRDWHAPERDGGRNVPTAFYRLLSDYSTSQRVPTMQW